MIAPIFRSLLLTRVAAVVVFLAAGSLAHAQSKSAKSGDSEQAETVYKSVSIGDFFYRDVRPVEGVKIRLSFTLAMNVDEEKHALVVKILGSKRQRVRNAVLTAMRLCRVRNYQETDLHTLRQRIKTQIHWIAPELPLGDLLISEFAYFTD